MQDWKRKYLGMSESEDESPAVSPENAGRDDKNPVPQPPFNAKKTKRCPFPFPEEEPPDAPFPNAPVPRGLARKIIRYLVDDRWIKVYNNRALLTDRTRRKDQSDIFYPMRTMLYEKGYDVEGFFKKPDGSVNEEKRIKLYSYIKEYCERRGIKRHQIGIFPAERAVMAYNGHEHFVNFENYDALATWGVEVVLTEKDTLVTKFAPFTEGVGIALVHSQGFVAEYGEMLAQKAKAYGGNVMVLTDYDSDGIRIASYLENIVRIGIDYDTIKEINALIKKELDPQAVPEDEAIYIPDNDDLDPPAGQIEELDVNDRGIVEMRPENDSWINLKKLTEGWYKKTLGDREYTKIERTPHQLSYIRVPEKESNLYGQKRQKNHNH